MYTISSQCIQSVVNVYNIHYRNVGVYTYEAGGMLQVILITSQNHLASNDAVTDGVGGCPTHPS